LIRAHKGRYQLEEFTKSFGGIIEGMNTDSMIGRYWGPLNLIRWALTIVVMVFLNQHSVTQIFILLLISAVFQIMMLIGKPMTDKWDRRINWMIEVSVSIYLYVLLSLTDFMGETKIRDELGWILTILTGIVVAVNV
jgi:hypothetical protein